jgi:cobalt/nickel transport system permease protein
MHIPDGFLSAPVYVAGYAASGAVCALAVSRANRRLGEREVPLLGMTAAFVFAAQMLNFPVAGGTSGHFLGSTLAAVLLGPLNACLVMAVVLTIQCLGFADGGLTALGANLFNMGIVGAIGGWLLFRVLRAVLPGNRRGFLAAAAAASWVAVVVASVFCAGELAWSGTSPLRIALPAMAGVHALIGIGEAVITVAVLSSVLAVRPDLVAEWDRTAKCGVRSAECGVQEARP